MGPKRSSSRKRRTVITVVAVILTMVLVGGFVFIQGNVSGVEFSPTHFRTREFAFYEIPLVSIQLTPIQRKDITGSTERQLRARSLINVPAGPPPEPWDLVRIDRGPTSTPGLAALLIDEIQLSDANQPFWNTWNSDYPNRAAVIWPLIQRLAERELYVLIPELLSRARSLPGGDDSDRIAGDIESWMVNEYRSLVTDLRDSGRETLAASLLSEALTDYPNSEALKELKSSLSE